MPWVAATHRQSPCPRLWGAMETMRTGVRQAVEAGAMHATGAPGAPGDDGQALHQAADEAEGGMEVTQRALDLARQLRCCWASPRVSFLRSVPHTHLRQWGFQSRWSPGQRRPALAEQTTHSSGRVGVRLVRVLGEGREP
ncbi:unnamed protein product [Mycena citricolor]|uniref:Uncharacterized protein n=1 Tax=Mycena citricolor TaxID=2018698 RepID=A0AAD2K103_9AGAR|nr:unnamed protein product [Mycena citricolor]